MLIAEIIRRKRDGHRLGAEAMDSVAAGLAGGNVGDAQAAAFAMAVFFQDLDADECAALTRSMARSGQVLGWDAAELGGPVLDKHSTGGIGDVVSLILAPAVAACGAFVPMIAGRGLGHTGGTVDKLEAIPGYRTAPGLEAFRNIVERCGCAIIGQTAELAPADRRLYAIRDVTATVESIALITASILAKKLAAGLHGLVMDVKTGSGAFMPTVEKAEALARRLVEVGTRAGLPVAARLTDMNEPLASAAGNALEVRVALDHLTGRTQDARLHAVVVALGADMLRLGGLAPTNEDARDKIERALASGAAAARFAGMVSALGGPRDLLEKPDAHLPAAPVVRGVPAPTSGRVQAIETRALGLVVVALGGGRRDLADRIDSRVGLSECARVGDRLQQGEPLARVHAADDAAAARAIADVQAAYRLGEEAPSPPPVIGLPVTAAR